VSTVSVSDTTAGLRAAPDRGELTIADRVLEKVAVTAAAEIDGVLPAPSAGLTRAMHPGRHISADADQRDDHRVELALVLAVRYPMPVWATARAVRRHVTERVRQLTGREVADLSIAVTYLTHPGEERPRRVE
jgi:uncharacterized alkaline shock family protein YloU